MLARFRARLTYANVMATLALFVALGGTGYAASQITSQDIKNRTIKGGDIRKDTITGTEIRESRLRQVPSALNSVNSQVADLSKNSQRADTVAAANVVQDAQTLVGQGANVFERASRTQFGRAPVNPADANGEQVVLDFPALGAQVTSATNQAACGAGTLRVAVKNTKAASNPVVRVFQTGGGDEPVVAPGGKSYMCTNSADESLRASLTDANGNTLFVDCLTADGDLRCIGVRSTP
jgi:hypothetical protein